MLDELKKSLLECPVVEKGDYHYFVHPISDGVPLVEPGLLEDIADYVIENYDMESVDKIVGIQSMGIPLATALSLKSRVPFLIIRKRSYGLVGEVQVHQETGYGESELFINGLSEGDNIILMDDVVSTGGTLTSVINTLDDMGVNIVGIIIPLEKDDGRVNVEKNTNHKLDTLVKIKMVDGKVTILDD